jgi:thiol-disulfide isomerase/thioredoxin
MAKPVSLVLGLILLGAVLAAAAPTEFDTDVDGLQTLLHSSKYTFVIFHGHDCPYCDFLRTSMGQLSEELGETYPGLKFSLVNAEAFHDVRKKHSIESYPVGKLFAGPTFFNFFIQRLSRENIRAFIEDTLGKKATPIEISSDKAYVKYNNLDYALVFAMPEIGETERAFAQAVQDLFPQTPLFYTQTGSKWDKLLFKDKPETKKFRMYFKRDFDEGDKSFARKEMFDPEDLAATLRRIKDPRIALITRMHSDEIFSGLHPGLVVFDKDLHSEKIATLTKVLLANPFAGVPLKTNGTDPYSEAFLNHLGVRESDFPTLRIIGVGGGKISKFKYEGDWSEKDLIQWLRKFKESQLTTYLKNAPKAAPSASKVGTWNRDQYLENIEDTENVLVVGFVARWCPKCHGFHELLEKTREKLRDKKSFILATVDLDMNDIDGLDHVKLPLIHIIQGGQPRTYEGELDAAALATELNGIMTDEL